MCEKGNKSIAHCFEVKKRRKKSKEVFQCPGYQNSYNLNTAVDYFHFHNM